MLCRGTLAWSATSAEQPVIEPRRRGFNLPDYLDAVRGGHPGFLRDRDLAHLVNHGALVDGEDPPSTTPSPTSSARTPRDGLAQEHREDSPSGTTSGG